MSVDTPASFRIHDINIVREPLYRGTLVDLIECKRISSLDQSFGPLGENIKLADIAVAIVAVELDAEVIVGDIRK